MRLSDPTFNGYIDLSLRRVRRSKADLYGPGRVAFTSTRNAQLVGDWIDWRGSGIRWLFCPIYQGHPIDRGLEVTTIRRLVKNAALKAGFDASDVGLLQWTFHARRSGAGSP